MNAELELHPKNKPFYTNFESSKERRFDCALLKMLLFAEVRCGADKTEKSVK